MGGVLVHHVVVGVLLLAAVVTAAASDLKTLKTFDAVRAAYPNATPNEIASILAAMGGGRAQGGTGGVPLASEVLDALDELDLTELAPTLRDHGIETKDDLLLLDAESVKHLGVRLGTQLRLLRYIREQKDEAATSEATAGPVAAIVGDLIEKNNAMLLARMQDMVDTALSARGAPPAQQQRKRQLQAASGNAVATAANLEGAGMWIEEDGAKVCFGADASVSLMRPANGEKVLAASGGLRVGEVDDLACGAEQTGTLRWFSAKKTLQVCEGSSEKWKAAGGAVLDDEEPCNADNRGALQSGDVSLLSVCMERTPS